MARTTKSTDYAELLRDPRWQRVRTEVMTRADFQCERCGDASTTLSVHHTYYEFSLKPWEYPSESLRCLCEPCHKECQELYKEIKRVLGWLDGNSTKRLIGYAAGLALQGDTCDVYYPEDGVSVRSEEYARGVEDAWRLKRNCLSGVVGKEKIDAGFLISLLATEAGCGK